MQRSVEHLGERELGLQDRHLVADAGDPVGAAVRVWQPRQPLAQQRVDTRRGEAPRQPLYTFGVCTTEDAIIEFLVGDAHTGQLPLQVFVPVEAQLGVEREVGAEFDEERAEVLIDGIDRSSSS